MSEPQATLVSELTGEQIDQLVALYRNEFWCSQRTRSDVERMLHHTDILVGAVDEADNLIGFVRVLTDYAYKAAIFDLIVRPDWRGRDLGRRLMDAVISHPELRNVEHFDLNCLPEMFGFYEKWGFTSDIGGLGFMRRFNRGN
jgi:ribosomal protein S18 acetylase RimI-like enzyme